MGEAAPHAALSRPANGQALEVLRLEWGQFYRVGWDAVRGWWARRRDGLGGDITADDPGELRTAVSEDYALKPVPRELAGYRRAGVPAPVAPAGDTG